MNTIINFLRTTGRLFLALLACFVGDILVTKAQGAGLAADKSFLSPVFAKATPPERALLLPDGKYLLFFDPDTLTDQLAGAIVRFLPDGSVDTSLSFTREYKRVNAAVDAGNGKLYVSATRYAYGTLDAEQILRLNGDGSIDPSFTPPTVGGTDGFPDVWQMIVQPDGKVLVAGNFGTFAGNDARDGIVRLLSDGTVDSTFAPVTVSGLVYSMALQSDGKVLIGGVFSSVNNVANPGVVRLNADGTLDSSFLGTGFARNTSSSRIRGILVQPDGQILISGSLRTGSGSSIKRMTLLRLNPTGTVDSTFNSVGVVPSVNTARDLLRQPDGKIVVVINNSVYRLNTDGSNDSSFHQPAIIDARFIPPTSPGTPVTVQRSSDGHILLGGIFTDADPSGSPNFRHFGVVRLDANGNVDSSLVSSHRTGNEVAPSAFVRLGDGSTLAVFNDNIDPSPAYNVGRLLSNGSLDPTFTLSSSDPNRFLTNGFSARGLAYLPDGNLFVYGVQADGTPVYGKIQPNGAEDTTFATNHGIAFQTATVAPDGKLLVCVGSDPQMALYNLMLGRLSTDGKIDNFGVPSSILQGQVIRMASGQLDQINVSSQVVAVQPDGKILFQYLGVDQNFHFVRLNADGSLDGNFSETILVPIDLREDFPVVFDPVNGAIVQPPDGVWTAPSSLKDGHVQADGRIIVAGHFSSFGNTTARDIVRLNANGSPDNTFNAGAGPQWTSVTQTATLYPAIENIEPLADGKLIVTGNFEAFNGVAAPGIARLNADGSVDNSFVAPVHRDKRSLSASAFKAQPDGSFLLGGPYTFIGESTSHSVIRLIGAEPGAVNISTRLGVGTGDDALIEGFIVQGPAGSSKKMLVRAIGPSLTQFGISDALQNPTLEIHDASGATVATNNDWKITQTGGLITGDQFAEINASGAAPTNDLESAIIAPLQPGSYTAVVRGAGNTTGTGVVDAFDLDQGSSARLANIATRGLVQPGEKLMIAGFIVQNGAVKVVIRAIGPSLQAFGISNALPDTTLQLRDQQGTIVLENDDWKTSQQQELESLGLQPSHDLEAALVDTIQPGQYTAQLRGKGNDSGIGVVQVYFLQ